MEWYVAHTYASQEFKIKEAIEKKKEGTKFENKIGQILIPTQKTFHIRDGKKIERDKKLFNSYIIIEADLSSEIISFILGIPGVTNFLGTGKKPHPLSKDEVNRLLGIADRKNSEEENIKILPGDMVKITDGPFNDFDGVVEKISDDKQRLSVKVTVFGRETSVEVRTEHVSVL